MPGFRHKKSALSSGICGPIAMNCWMHGMSTLEIEAGDLRARLVEFTATELVVTLMDGRRIATPLEWYPTCKCLRGAAVQLRDPGDGDSLALSWRGSGRCRNVEGAESPVRWVMTDDLKKLLEAVKTAAPTPEHREEQRRSFVYGNTHLENELITREMVAREAEKLAGNKK